MSKRSWEFVRQPDGWDLRIAELVIGPFAEEQTAHDFAVALLAAVISGGQSAKATASVVMAMADVTKGQRPA
jgi:hypothetical protein